MPASRLRSRFAQVGLSGPIIVLVVITCGMIDHDLGLWRKSDRVIEYDVRGYYGFLPLIFIYDDIRLEDDYYQADGSYLFWPNTTSDGRHFIKYPVGMALLYAPFFFIGHGVAHLTGAPVNGFSAPYKILLIICALFYLTLGLLMVRWILERLGFSEISSAITILLVGAGTNLLCYSTQSGTMPHVHGFFLFAAFAYLTIRWHERATWGRTALLGLVFGLITLVRPTNSAVILFFILYGVTARSQMKQRAMLFARSFPKLTSIALITLALWVPQFLYWHIATGHWIFYAYQDEGFFFSHPHLWDGLFSFRKGWLLYAPVMAFAIVGFFLLRGRSADWRWGTALTLAVHAYITFSWWCWWYGGSYGQRAMIETYALLAVPLCAFIERARTWRPEWRFSLAALGGFFIWLNIFQTYQFEEKILHYDGMSMELYLAEFGKMHPVDNYEEMVDHPDYQRARLTGR